jgi:hypothetical protein
MCASRLRNAAACVAVWSPSQLPFAVRLAERMDGCNVRVKFALMD